MKVAVCKSCGARYTDPGSIALAEKMSADGYAPCPFILCSGEISVVDEDGTTQNKDREVIN